MDSNLNSLLNDIVDIKRLENKSIKIREIAPIEEWINSDYYIGPDASSIYPFWKQHIINIFNSPTRINEVILTGGLGTGKTTVGNIIMLRRLYELSCYDNIPSLFNLMSSSKILFAYFNINMSQALLTGYGQIKEMIDSSPYFRENFPRNYRRENEIAFPQANLQIRYASGTQHTIGSNLVGSLLDEANFYSKTEKITESEMMVQDKAKKIYTDARNRGKSRFLINGENYSMSILVSSTTFDSSFTNQRLKETEGDPHTYVVNARLWDVKPQNYSKERFYVFCGSGEIDPCIIDNIADINGILDSLGIDRVKDISIQDAIKHIPIELRTQIIEVPTDYLVDFRTNLLQSIQDIAGMTIAGQGKLFNSKENFDKCVYTPEEPAFTKDTFVISTKMETTPQDYINPNWKPENPDRLRFMHVDQGISSDHYGISSCFVEDAIINEDETITLKIKFDFILNIVPPRPPAKVDIAKVRSLIPWLAQNKGINWGMITYDQYQSQESMQELEKAGFPVGYQSVDRTDEAYLCLVDYIYNNNIKFPYNDEFERNLFNLVHFRERRKVDHTSTGGKDISDSVAGSLYNAIKSDVYTNIVIQNDVNILFDI